VFCFVVTKLLFNPDVIRTQLNQLRADRGRLDVAITSLEIALTQIERIESGQAELRLEPGESVTLHDAVKRVCQQHRDGITRQRVIQAIEVAHPFLKPKSSSVAASLINLTKGEHPMLKVAIEGSGRSPSYYSTDSETVHRLSAEEVKELFEPGTTKGTGGWQSLFGSLQASFDKAKGEINLSAEHRARIYQYYRAYGQGGWQERIKRIFRRELPHLFGT